MTDAEMVRFFTNGLLSKWGFEDGDMLIDFTYESDDWGAKQICDPHALLVESVRRFILPNLAQHVEVFEIGGIHNPIRAKSVDGAEFDNYNDPHQPDLLAPSVLVVEDEAIRELAESLQRVLDATPKGAE